MLQLCTVDLPDNRTEEQEDFASMPHGGNKDQVPIREIYWLQICSMSVRKGNFIKV